MHSVISVTKSVFASDNLLNFLQLLHHKTILNTAIFRHCIEISSRAISSTIQTFQ